MPIDITGVVLEVLTARVDPYAQLDPVDAAVDALATYFETVPGIAEALRGWPEHPKDLDLTAGPVVSLTAIGDTRTPVAPAAIDDGALYRTDELSIDVQLDLWTAYRAQRDEIGRAIADALHNSLPARSGLRLRSRGYHGRPLIATAGTGRNVDEPRAAAEGEWRRTWMLTVQTDLVSSHTVPTQTTITVRPTVADVVEPDWDIT